MRPEIITMRDYALQKAHKLQGRRTFQGLEISVENKAGSYRRWYDRFEKKEGKTKQHYDYGYIRGTLGTDGDHVDVYVGSNEAAEKVYVIDQMKGPEFREFDEQKVMLGFDSDTDAKAAYLKHFDKPGFFGSIRPMEVGDFRRCVLNKENHGQPIDKSLRNELRKAGGDTHLIHEIHEDATRGYPVVTHVFTGKDRKEAQGYYEAHLETDSFMLAMEKKGEFKGIKGRTKKYFRTGGPPQPANKGFVFTLEKAQKPPKMIFRTSKKAAG